MSRNQGPHKMRQFHKMVGKLHEMLQSLGEQSVGNSVIKLDEFQKLRRAFSLSAQTYETCNNQIKSMSDRVHRAQIMFRIIQSKKTMQQSLKQMTTISIRLKQKMSKDKVRQGNNKYKTPQKKKKQWQISEEKLLTDKIQQPLEQTVEKNPLEKELEYKTLVLYNMQRIYYKLVQGQRKQVASTRKDLVKNKFAGLEELKKDAERRKQMEEMEEEGLTKEEQLEQQDIIQAIKRLDDHIQSKMVPILQGIQKMHGHALSISNSIGDVHKLILVNLELTNKNVDQLGDAQKMLDKVTPHARKPSCICNVVLCFLLALVAFLLLKLFGVFDKGSVTPS